MKKFFRKIWNTEIRNVNHKWYARLFVLMIIVGIGYVIVEVAFMKYPDFSWTTYQDVMAQPELMPSGHEWLRANYIPIWLWLAVACMAFRFAVIVFSYLQSWRIFDKNRFLQHFVVYSWCAFIGIATALLFALMLGFLGYLMGFNFGDSMQMFDQAALQVETWIADYVPTIVTVNSYPLALFLVFIFSSLPTYFIHWLSHRSRLLWYTLHRPHHAPEILHPLASAPAFLFEYVFAIPKIIVAASVAKLFYHEALVLEGGLIFLLFYFVEIFNHSSAHYSFSYRNPIVRNLSRLVGDTGVYHYVHHSSALEDQMVNLAGGPFNMWDRIFGTYRKPPAETPSIGLTGNPEIKMNPFRILFSGFAQIYFELRENRDWKSRIRILLGSVNYKPAASREFLIQKSESDVRAAATKDK